MKPMTYNGLRSAQLKTPIDEDGNLKWSEDELFLVPEDVSHWGGADIEPNGVLAIRPNDLKFQNKDLPALLRESNAFTEIVPASTRLPINYQFIPAPVRRTVARFIGLWNRGREETWASFPRWPVDLSVDFLSDLCRIENPFVEGPTPVVLSHDIDTPLGCRNLVNMFLPIEEKHGARSVNYIVPFAWKHDEGVLREIVDRGHEIGVHGYDHSNTTPFADRSTMRSRLQKAKEFADSFGAYGYRAPSLLRTSALIEELASIYDYDSSIPTTGGRFPQANTGCATARPFLIRGIKELPITMPRDASMRFMMYSPDKIYRIWVDTAVKISRSRGVVVLLTHCEPQYSGNKSMLSIYEKFLEYINESKAYTWASSQSVLNTAFP